jgi:hypothetical protein
MQRKKNGPSLILAWSRDGSCPVKWLIRNDRADWHRAARDCLQSTDPDAKPRHFGDVMLTGETPFTNWSFSNWRYKMNIIWPNKPEIHRRCIANNVLQFCKPQITNYNSQFVKLQITTCNTCTRDQPTPTGVVGRTPSNQDITKQSET